MRVGGGEALMGGEQQAQIVSKRNFWRGEREEYISHPDY
jgi:hypothetical protein